MAREHEYRPRIPVSTYRLQLNREFTFSDARRIIGYLTDLGITDVYASSYLKARQGSLHGYDIVDFGELNDEIGSPAEYEAFVAEQKAHGLGQIFDLVPNHMCVADDNRWWMDVLENGPSSIYARFFDINWNPVKRELKNRILVPFLGDQYGEVLENQELRLRFKDGRFFVAYWDYRFPLRPDSYIKVLAYRLKELEAALEPSDPSFIEFLSINTALSHLPPYTETGPEATAERNREKEIVKRRLARLYEASPEIRRHIDRNVEIFNGTKDEPESFDLLDDLLSDQAFRLSYWRVATEEINYRRFFDINDLAAIRMEDPAVFDETHRLVFRLIREGKVTGLRVDHPDGLYDPSRYFHRLQRNCYIETGLMMKEASKGHIHNQAEEAILPEVLGRRYDELTFSGRKAKPFYIIGEKILMRNEPMPEEWPIFSTTGYTFMNLVNGIFVDCANEKAFERLYRRLTRSPANYARTAYEKKKLIMLGAMSSEINTLGNYLNRISEKNRHTRDFTLNSLTGAIVEIIASFPVYRTYINSRNIAGRDRQHIEYAVARAKAMNPTINESVFNFVKRVLLLQWPAKLGEDRKKNWLDFVMRFQQITGPVVAKGLEDTAFYTYNRLVSLNEVGGSPDRFGTPVEEFHEHNLKRQKFWPHALITTSTHDSKRSEDVRARINVLSEVPEEWKRRVMRWGQINRKKRLPVNGGHAPDPNEEYFLYQTLVGAWPMQAGSAAEWGDFVDRMKNYLLKAMREAKVNTSWINPKSAYEEAASKFVEAILDRGGPSEFIDDFEAFHRKVAYCGMCNSLSQTLLKITSPGVPDFYQGTEVWTFSLVDPDNRRPVDYEGRMRMLADLRAAEQEAPLKAIAAHLAEAWQDGRIKMHVMSKALAFRKECGRLLDRMRYVPLRATGARAANVCAFARRAEGTVFITAAPRFLMGLLDGSDGRASVRSGAWDESFLLVPSLRAACYENVFTGEPVRRVRHAETWALPLADLFRTYPVALLKGSEPARTRRRPERGGGQWKDGR
jgi:(1->4)-alpha-D-glucan 1-alpha-D-glucosylmutase